MLHELGALGGLLLPCRVASIIVLWFWIKCGNVGWVKISLWLSLAMRAPSLAKRAPRGANKYLNPQYIFLVQIMGQISFALSLVFLSINCFVNLVKENPPCFLPRTISICLYFAQSRLYKRFNFEVEVSLGKFWKQVCITSQSGRPTREIWKKTIWEKKIAKLGVKFAYLTQSSWNFCILWIFWRDQSVNCISCILANRKAVFLAWVESDKSWFAAAGKEPLPTLRT